MKKFTEWENSSYTLKDYLQYAPCQIDEDLYNYIGECVSPTYCADGLIQGGDCQFIEDGVEFYNTVRLVNNKYYYLGTLPSFKQ